MVNTQVSVSLCRGGPIGVCTDPVTFRVCIRRFVRFLDSITSTGRLFLTSPLVWTNYLRLPGLDKTRLLRFHSSKSCRDQCNFSSLLPHLPLGSVVTGLSHPSPSLSHVCSKPVPFPFRSKTETRTETDYQWFDYQLIITEIRSRELSPPQT